MMDRPAEGKIPNEKTPILPDSSSTDQQHNKINGIQIASQLPKFEVPGDDSSADASESSAHGPRLTEGAFPAARGGDGPMEEKSTFALASFNFINSIVGSGVIGMPYALKQSGFGAGILLLVLIAGVTDYSLIMLIESAQIVGVSNYQDLVRETFGRPGFLILSVFQLMYPFVCLISYNIIVGDTLTKVLIRLTGISPITVVAKREFIITAVTLLITLPLSLYRNISRLAKISLVSVLIVVFIVVSMLFRMHTMREYVKPTPDAWTFAKPNLASAIGIMSFAFMCHHFSFLVYDSLQDNTKPRWNKATHTSVGIAMLLSILFAVSGFVTFTGYSQGDIFENYCWDDDLMNLGRGLYAFTILLTYPIECFVTREVLENLFFSQYQPQPFFRHAALTVIVAILGFLFSLTTDCLGIVLQLNGLFCALPMAYIMPPLCFIRVKEGPLLSRSKVGALAVIAGGCIILLIGCITMFANYDELSTCSHGIQMPYCYPHRNDTTV